MNALIFFMRYGLKDSAKDDAKERAVLMEDLKEGERFQA